MSSGEDAGPHRTSGAAKKRRGCVKRSILRHIEFHRTLCQVTAARHTSRLRHPADSEDIEQLRAEVAMLRAELQLMQERVKCLMQDRGGPDGKCRGGDSSKSPSSGGPTEQQAARDVGDAPLQHDLVVCGKPPAGSQPAGGGGPTAGCGEESAVPEGGSEREPPRRLTGAEREGRGTKFKLKVLEFLNDEIYPERSFTMRPGDTCAKLIEMVLGDRARRGVPGTQVTLTYNPYDCPGSADLEKVVRPWDTPASLNFSEAACAGGVVFLLLFTGEGKWTSFQHTPSSGV